MLLLIEESAKRAKESVFNDGDTVLPDFVLGETVPISVGRIQRIPEPTDSRLFVPLDSTGWALRAGLGLGFTPLVAGVWYLQSGIALTAGLLTTGKRYKIVNFIAGDVFTNIGAGSNATGIIFTATGTTPTTWTHASEVQEITANLDYDATAAEIQTALLATAWIAAAGNATVADIGTSGTYFAVTFTAAGARSEMVGNGDNLAPLSDVDLGTLIDGSAQLQEVQTIQISQQPATYVDLPDALAGVTSDVDEVTTGDADNNAKYRISLTADLLYGGSFTVTVPSHTKAVTSIVAGVATTSAAHTLIIGQRIQFSALVAGAGGIANGTTYFVKTVPTGLTFTYAATSGGAALSGHSATSGTLTAITEETDLIAFDASADALVAALEALSNVGSGNIEAEAEESSQWLIQFIAGRALTDMGDLTIDDGGVLAITGKSGLLDLRVPGVDLTLNGAPEKTVTFSIRAIPPAGTPRVIFRQDVTLTSTIFTPASETPQPRAEYYTKDEVDALLADPANFAALDLSGLPVADPGGGKPWLNGGVMQIGP